MAELIFDPDPPVILISGGESQQIYHADPIISGFVEDANLEGIWFRAEAEGVLEPLQVQAGRFEFPVVLHDGENMFELVARDRAGHETTEHLLVQFESILSELKTPRAPSQLFATLNAPTVRLHWSSPLVFDDGTPIPEGIAVKHQVYRDNTLVAELDQANTYDDHAPARDAAYAYNISSVLKSTDGQVFESSRSDVLRVQAVTPVPATKPGTFEPPSFVTDGVRSARRPSVSTTTHKGQTVAHLAYLIAGDENAGPQVRYQASQKAGMPGSFGAPEVMHQLPVGQHVDHVVVAARPQKEHRSQRESRSAPRGMACGMEA